MAFRAAAHSELPAAEREFRRRDLFTWPRSVLLIGGAPGAAAPFAPVQQTVQPTAVHGREAGAGEEREKGSSLAKGTTSRNSLMQLFLLFFQIDSILFM